MLLLMMVAAAASQAQPTAAVSPDAKGLQTVGDAIKWMQDHPKEASALAIKPVARPLGYPGQWIRPDDYPPTALRQNVEGNTEFRLSVDSLGKPVACAILISSGSGILDDATCNLIMKRALFSAPLDSAGRPTTSTYTSTVRWVVPKVPPVLISPVDMSVSFDVDPKGKIGNCATSMTAEGTSPIAVQVAELCTMLSGTKVNLLPTFDPTTKHRVTTRFIVTIDGTRVPPAPVPARIDTPLPRP